MEPNRGMKMAEGPATIFIVEDEPDIRIVIKARLEAAGYRVETAATGTGTGREECPAGKVDRLEEPVFRNGGT